MQPIQASAQLRPRISFSRSDGSYQLSLPAFRDAYEGQVVEAVARAQGVAAPATSPLAGQSVAVAYAVARQLLGPVQAVVLGGAAMASLVGSKEAADLDQGMLQRMQARPVGRVDGGQAGIFLGDEKVVGHGASTNASVILPEGFASLLPHPVGSFLVGHELGHVQSNDIVHGFGHHQLVSALAGSELAEEAERVAQQLDHQAEFAADQRGLSYALSQGHERAAVLAGFERFLTVATDGQASESHPAAVERVTRLAKPNAAQLNESGVN